jgi:hypothetical protein
MAVGNDIDSSLPIRSVADGNDERVHVKIVDYTDPSGVDKQVQISEKKVHVRNFSKDSDGNDQEVLLSQEGHIVTNGDYDATSNKRPSSSAAILHDRTATTVQPTEAEQNFRPTGVSYDDGVAVVNSADVALHDESGVPYSKSNPLPVSIEESEGDEIHVSKETASKITKNNSEDHVYTSVAPVEFELEQWGISASGYMKGELFIETGVGTDTFISKGVLFNSTAMPNANLELKRAIKIATGVKVKIVMTNLDNQSQALYSFMNGLSN